MEVLESISQGLGLAFLLSQKFGVEAINYFVGLVVFNQDFVEFCKFLWL